MKTKGIKDSQVMKISWALGAVVGSGIDYIMSTFPAATGICIITFMLLSYAYLKVFRKL